MGFHQFTRLIYVNLFIIDFFLFFESYIPNPQFNRIKNEIGQLKKYMGYIAHILSNILS